MRSGRLTDWLGNGLVQAVLIVVALVWITPLAGLFLSSMRSEQDNAADGWWTALTDPGQLSLDNYTALLEDSGITQAFWNTVADLRARHRPGRRASPRSPDTPSPGWSSPAGTASSWSSWGCSWCPCRSGCCRWPNSSARVGLFGTIPGVVLFHVAYGLPFAIFLLRNYFAEIPREMLEAARMDGGGEWRIFSRLVLPLGPARDRQPGHLPVPLGLERHAGRAALRRQRRPSRSRSPSSPQMRQFGSNIDVLAPGRVPLPGGAAGRLLRLPAALRPGGDGGLGEVSLVHRPHPAKGAGDSGHAGKSSRNTGTSGVGTR